MPSRRGDSLSVMCVVLSSSSGERTLNHTVRRWLSEILEKHIQLERYDVYKAPKSRSPTKSMPK